MTIAVYNSSPDTGGTGICNTPPTVLAPPGFGAGKYFVGGFTPVLEGDTLTPATGTTPNGFPCTSPRVAISTSAKVFFGGRRVCKVGDVLNATTNIRIGPGATTGRHFTV